MPVVSMLRDIQTQTFGHEAKEESGMFMIRASPTLMHTHTGACMCVKQQTNTPSTVTMTGSSFISSLGLFLGVGAYRIIIWRQVFLDRVKMRQPKTTKSPEEVKLENVNFIATLSFYIL